MLENRNAEKQTQTDTNCSLTVVSNLFGLTFVESLENLLQRCIRTILSIQFCPHDVGAKILAMLSQCVKNHA